MSFLDFVRFLGRRFFLAMSMTSQGQDQRRFAACLKKQKSDV